ncbi:MAG: YihY/virulence factor BrkB family protein [Puniceicoccales bacterium]
MSESSEQTQTQPWWQRARENFKRVPNLVSDEIWRTQHVQDDSRKGKLFGLLRVFALVADGLWTNRIPSQAAALSYFTLIALGPIVAIAIMVSGFVMPDDGRDRIADALTDAVYFVAPSAQQAKELELTVPDDDGANLEEETVGKQVVESELEGVIDGLVENSRSSTIGVVGSLALILISVQLLSTIEKTFNMIWGVSRNRTFFQQVVFYWAVISLGAVAAVTLLTVGIYSKIAKVFDDLPMGDLFRDSILSLTPLFVFVLAVGLLTLFNRFIPNARVQWKPALLGSLLVTVLLYLNQLAGFLYIGMVIRQQTLFGTVGILPVLLFGLFVFWLILLLGGQLTYAIQNVDRLTHQRAWENTSRRARELLALATIAIVGRRFEACEPPLTADELSERIRVPANVLNLTITQLVNIGLLNVVEPTETEGAQRYQPGRPMDRISLAEFKKSIELHGNNEALKLLSEADPLVDEYSQILIDLPENHPSFRSLRELLLASEPKNVQPS